MPDRAFKMMALMFKIRDILVHRDKILDEFGIRQGQRIVDYGCGPGSYRKESLIKFNLLKSYLFQNPGMRSTMIV